MSSKDTPSSGRVSRSASKPEPPAPNSASRSSRRSSSSNDSSAWSPAGGTSTSSCVTTSTNASSVASNSTAVTAKPSSVATARSRGNTTAPTHYRSASATSESFSSPGLPSSRFTSRLAPHEGQIDSVRLYGQPKDSSVYLLAKSPSNRSSGFSTAKSPSDRSSGYPTARTPSDRSSGFPTAKTPSDRSSDYPTAKTPSFRSPLPSTAVQSSLTTSQCATGRQGSEKPQRGLVIPSPDSSRSQSSRRSKAPKAGHVVSSSSSLSVKKPCWLKGTSKPYKKKHHAVAKQVEGGYVPCQQCHGTGKVPKQPASHKTSVLSNREPKPLVHKFSHPNLHPLYVSTRTPPAKSPTLASTAKSFETARSFGTARSFDPAAYKNPKTHATDRIRIVLSPNLESEALPCNHERRGLASLDSFRPAIAIEPGQLSLTMNAASGVHTPNTNAIAQGPNALSIQQPGYFLLNGSRYQLAR